MVSVPFRFRATFGLAFQPPIVGLTFQPFLSSVDLSVRSYRLLGTRDDATRGLCLLPGTIGPLSRGTHASKVPCLTIPAGRLIGHAEAERGREGPSSWPATRTFFTQSELAPYGSAKTRPFWVPNANTSVE